MANLKMIKHRLLHCRYGKFDEVENLFNQAELHQLKPRIIWEKMIAKLELKVGDINRVSFYSWLSRYRRKSVLSKAGNVSNSSWKDFEITDPANLRIADRDDVNFVNYKNKNL